METTKLKRFAQYARRSLRDQVQTKLNQALAEESAARRESAAAIRKLEEAIQKHTKDQVIERVAYIWFNRFCALRFMDVNRYNRVNIVSPADPGQFQPEILAEAKMGHIDEEMVHDKIRQQIFVLLDGKMPSRDPQGEAYRLLVVTVCNYWNKAMPFLFQRIDDYTELLMPDDLLSGNSILAYTREAMTPETCVDVEVIGWLYQFYISEKKDEVFDGLKKNKKITPENIPAATQLFTPHWIVRYLVENSLGRLWLLNRPSSKLAEQMDYYIKPAQAETHFLHISKPEEIKICDPACGSGHMLTYTFDLLYSIYAEEYLGLSASEIVEKILGHNIFGIEIDERAGELAAFALTMKAQQYDKRFLRKQLKRPNSEQVKPNICVLQNIDNITQEPEWPKALETMQNSGVDRSSLTQNIALFAEANNFGSLLRPTLTSEQAQKAIAALTAYDESVKTPMIGHWELIEQCKTALVQADYLSPKYHVVIANPPYMGNRSMEGCLQVFAKDSYPNSKTDLFAMFIERNMDLVSELGSVAMITMQSWMFLSTFEALRTDILRKSTIVSMIHLGARAFDSIGGEVVSTTAFVITNLKNIKYRGSFLRLTDGKNEAEKDTRLKERRSNPFFASTEDFNKIPGNPIAYWVSDTIRNIFTHAPSFGEIVKPKVGLQTGSNETFMRAWHEVSLKEISFSQTSREEAVQTGLKWFPYNKGGDWRKWYGNCEYVVDWEDDGIRIRNFKDESGKVRSRPQNTEYYFKEGITWADITTNSFAARYAPSGFIFDVKGSSGFPVHSMLKQVIGLMNSKLMFGFMQILNPTTTFQVGDMARVPFHQPENNKQNLDTNVKRLITHGKRDWDSYELSWDFAGLELLNPDYRQPTLKAIYQKLRAHWLEMTLEMQRLEQDNNRIFIEAYGLKDELDEEIDLREITLTCNPHYRYGGDKTEEELEALLLADTMRELVSYAVGCMFGRYALDKPGLILANQGETIAEYLKQIPEPSFPADDDNVIPMLDGDWFTDDVTERFHKFLRVTFGDEHYEENLKFVEKALGKDIGKYFAKVDVKKTDNFYGHHVTSYKKRPIYWLFSSPNGSFNALIYMHRYRPDTVSVVLNDYLREFRTKLTAHKNHLEAVSISASAAQGEKTKALKEIEKTKKLIAELEDYEREVLYPLATRQINIDLDDGVKVNYPKFGAALKKIPGLDAKDE